MGGGFCPPKMASVLWELSSDMVRGERRYVYYAHLIKLLILLLKMCLIASY